MALDREHLGSLAKLLKPDFGFLEGLYSRVQHVGSRATVSPPPTDTDDDWLFLCPGGLEGLNKFIAKCYEHGFSESCGSMIEKIHETIDFTSLAIEDEGLNIIVTHRKAFWRRFIRATKVATILNVKEKEDRVVLFQAILYFNDPKVEN